MEYFNKILIPLFMVVGLINSYAISYSAVTGEEMKGDSTNIIAKSEMLSNSLIVSDENDENDESRFVPIEEFTYAGHRRYLIDGSQPNKETKLRTVPSIVTGGLLSAAVVGLYINQRNAWWSGRRRDFHFEEDWIYCKQVDKAGHSYGGYLCSYIATESLLTSGFSPDAAHIWGSVMGLGYQTYIEFEDGLAQDWGFAPTDFYFDFAGAAFFLARWFVPELQNFELKWQYAPAKWQNKPLMDRPTNFLDDYNSSTFWLSAKVHNLLPKEYQKYWPKWLNLSLGYGADALDHVVDPSGPPDQLANRRFVIGLDYDVTELLPDGGSTWMWFKQAMSNIKLPAPALEITKSRTKFYWIYPFTIKI